MYDDLTFSFCLCGCCCIAVCKCVDWQLCLSVRLQGTWWKANWRWQSSTSTSSLWTPRSLWRESLSSSWMPTSESSTGPQCQRLKGGGVSFLIVAKWWTSHWRCGWQFQLFDGLVKGSDFAQKLHLLPVSVLTVVREPPCCCSSCPMDKLSSTPETSELIPQWRPTLSYSAAGCRRSTWTPR